MLLDELSGYKMTDLFAVFHEGVRDRLVADYGVKLNKISVLGRGTNLEAGSIASSRRKHVAFRYKAAHDGSRKGAETKRCF